MHTKFHKDWLRHLQADKEAVHGNVDTEIDWRSHKLNLGKQAKKNNSTNKHADKNE
jgi:hypothetical protein